MHFHWESLEWWQILQFLKRNYPLNRKDYWNHPHSSFKSPKPEWKEYMCQQNGLTCGKELLTDIFGLVFFLLLWNIRNEKNPKNCSSVFWQLTLTLCVIHSRPYWYTLLAAELSAFWMTWASGSQLGGCLKSEKKVNCYLLYPLHYTQNTLQINILKQQIIMVKDIQAYYNSNVSFYISRNRFSHKQSKNKSRARHCIENPPRFLKP